MRAVAIERDDEVTRRRQRDARLLDRDDQVERDVLVRGDDAEKPTDRLFKERAQRLARPLERDDLPDKAAVMVGDAHSVPLRGSEDRGRRVHERAERAAPQPE